MSRFIDLTDMTFGELHVDSYAGDLKWNCTCSCGKQLVVGGQSLRRGDRTSCGHTRGLARRTEDLEGMQFGDWTVLKRVKGSNYLCQCSCKNKTQRIINAYELKTGKTRSCGHNTTGFKDLTGKTFGEWTAQRYLGAGKWLCKCSCGKEGEVARAALLSGQSKSCGHATNAIVDLTGRTFGSLKVLRHVGYGRWECQCSCGNITVVRHTELLNGDSKSCGCKRSELIRNTMLERYGETAISKLARPRTDRQKWYALSRDNLLQAILENFSDKPTIYELSDAIGMSYSVTIKLIHKYGLDNEVKIYENSSRFESEIYSYIHGLKEDILIEKGNREILNGKEIDIYLPEYRLGIEFNGNYWHSDIFKEPGYHQHKTLLAAQKGIRLIQIFEYEWGNDRKKELLKELIKNIITTNHVVIYARKCEIKQINIQDERSFLEENHLQGYISSKVALGLYYDNELVEIMTFGKPRFNQEYEWEIIRLASKAGFSITGGAERLFKAFVDSHKPKNIVSYCDISKFTGGVYTKLKFIITKDGILRPNYVWVDAKTNRVVTRYQAQKHKLIESGLGELGDTEKDIMENLGFIKVYDCGNLRFTWTSPSLN